MRGLYRVPPPGDLLNCLSALSDAKPHYKELLTYRLAGNRWGRLDSIEGHKIGNLILVALTKILGDFNLALAETERLFNCQGKILPSTHENVSIWAETTKGEKVVGEETIDLGKYNDALYKVHLNPQNVSTPQDITKAIKKADLLIVGPGDLYTTILPVLLVPDIIKTLTKSSTKKVFILNIANKKETNGYSISDHLEAIKRHIDNLHFYYILVNNNHEPKFKPNSPYKYIPLIPDFSYKYGKILYQDLVDEKLPMKHDSTKLANLLEDLL